MNRKLSIADFLFDCIYLLGMIDSIALSLSNIGSLPHMGILRKSIELATLTMILVKFIFDRKYTLSSFVQLIVYSMVLLVSFVLSRYNHMLYLLFVLASIRNVNIHHAVFFGWIAKICMILLIIFCSLTGVIENFVTYRAGSSILRYSLGFNHPNTLAGLVLVLILEEAWLSKRPFSVLYMLAIWGIAAIVYLITLNRTAVLLMAVFPVALIWGSGRKAIGRYKKGVFLSVLPLITLFSILLMLYYQVPVFGFINNFLSGRFSIIHRSFQRYGFSLLGQKVVLVSVKDARLYQQSIATLDVAYLRCLIEGGAASFLIVFLIYTKLINGLCRNADRYTLVLVLMFFAYGLTEAAFNNAYLNFTLLFASKEVYSSDDFSLAYQPLKGNGKVNSFTEQFM